MKMVLVFLLAAGLASAQGEPQRITGTLRAPGQARVQGEVSAIANNRGVRITVARTDESGAYSLEVPAGTVTLIARADGFASEQRDIVVTSGNRNLRADFNLTRTGSVSGYVVDPSGSPVKDARVWLTYRGENSGWRTSDETGGDGTDGLGAFSVPAVAHNKPFVLHVESDTWLMSSSGTLQLRGGDLPGVILMVSRRGGIIRGRVTDRTGQPAARATIHLRAVPGQSDFTDDQKRGHAYGRTTQRFAQTASDGTFVIAGIPTGRVIVTAESTTSRAFAETTATAGQEVQVNLVVR